MGGAGGEADEEKDIRREAGCKMCGASREGVRFLTAGAEVFDGPSVTEERRLANHISISKQKKTPSAACSTSSNTFCNTTSSQLLWSTA